MRNRTSGMIVLASFTLYAVVVVTPLRGQVAVNKPVPSDARISEKDRAADDDRSRSDRRLMGMVVRLVPSSSVAWRSSALGKQVQAEGVAFRGHVHMDGCDIKVEGKRIDLTDDAYVGRLVRVKGALRYSRGVTSRFGSRAPYYFIDAEECDVVGRVGWPSLTASDDIGIPTISIADVDPNDN